MKSLIGLDEVQIKPGFEKRYRCLCGKDYDEFIKYSLAFIKRSLRVNTLKITVDEAKRRLNKKGWALEPIPWCKEGFWLEHNTGRRDIGNTTEHALGYIYIQEAASMIPPLVLEPKPGDVVLDMCASPGSKSSQMAAMMNNEGVLISNDFKGDRAKPLGINMQRIGATNNIVTMMNGQRIKDLLFDKVLVDAPCSGTGTIRTSLKTLRIWNEKSITNLSLPQKQLIETGFKLLKVGGILVYSTCSLEPEENEAVVSFLLEKYPNAKTLPIKLDIKRGEVVTEFEGKNYNEGVKNTLRIWPQDNNTEGFFVCKIMKTS